MNMSGLKFGAIRTQPQEELVWDINMQMVISGYFFEKLFSIFQYFCDLKGSSLPNKHQNYESTLKI